MVFPWIETKDDNRIFVEINVGVNANINPNDQVTMMMRYLTHSLRMLLEIYSINIDNKDSPISHFVESIWIPNGGFDNLLYILRTQYVDTPKSNLIPENNSNTLAWLGYLSDAVYIV